MWMRENDTTRFGTNAMEFFRQPTHLAAIHMVIGTIVDCGCDGRAYGHKMSGVEIKSLLVTGIATPYKTNAITYHNVILCNNSKVIAMPKKCRDISLMQRKDPYCNVYEALRN